MSWTANLSDAIGASESGLKLIIGQLLAYPVFLFFRWSNLDKQAPFIQHLYLTLTGVIIAAWSIGLDTIFHSFVCIVTTYLTLVILNKSFLSACLCFVFNLGYLIVGYYMTGTEGYDISWTMPHCVLCLRLIAVSMDCYDGSKNDSDLSESQKKTRLMNVPSLLELSSQCLFIGGYFVGPQFSMSKYQAYIQRNIDENVHGPVSFGFKRFGIGALYMAFHVIGSIKLPNDYVVTEEFKTMPFLTQSFWFSIWVKIILAKYIAAWLFAEGAVVISGLAYNGKDEQGKILWNGGANVKLRLFEKSSKFGHLIESFNINTNGWVATYIYKRLKFLNNRHISQLSTLVFLAVWHGVHSGYYLTFFNEFIIVNFEKDVSSIIKKNSKIQHWLTHPGAATLTWIIGKLYVTFMLPHCFLPFALLKSAKYIPVIYSTRGIVYLIFMTWPLYSVVIKKLLNPPPSSKSTQQTTTIKKDLSSGDSIKKEN